MLKRKVFLAVTLLSIVQALHINVRTPSHVFLRQPGLQISGPDADFAKVVASTLPAERLPVTGFG